MTLRHLDLFSGIGGFALSARWARGYETIGFCEVDPWCRRVLAKHWPGVPIHEDIHTLRGGDYDADIVTGGFPCQPFSSAGSRRGEDDHRHLWPQMARIIAEVRPAWIIGENVPHLDGLGLAGVLSDLEGLSYAVWPIEIPACAVGAPHERNRLWIVAHADHRPLRQKYPLQPGRYTVDSRGENGLADPHGDRLQQPKGVDLKSRRRTRDGRQACLAYDHGFGGDGSGRERSRAEPPLSGPDGALQVGQWPTWRNEPQHEWEPARLIKPEVGRNSYGVPHRVDRLRGLGNAIVPQVAAVLLRFIREIKEES